jgi:hypothetical protein
MLSINETRPSQWCRRSKRVGLLVLFALISVGLSGCLFTKSLRGKSRTNKQNRAPVITMKQVDQAAQAKDAKTLRHLCGHAGRLNRPAQKKACRAYIDLLDERGEAAKLLAICKKDDKGTGNHSAYACDSAVKYQMAAYKKALTCDSLETTYKQYYRSMPHHRGDDRQTARHHVVMAAGVKAAQCKKWNFVFRTLMPIGRYGRHSYGYNVLKHVEKAGHAVYKSLFGYMKRQKPDPFRFKGGSYAVNHMAHWIIDSGKTRQCHRFLPYAKASATLSRSAWLMLFKNSKCTKAASFAAKQLTAQSATVRLNACKALGRIGSKSHLRAVKAIAATDPAYDYRRQTQSARGPYRYYYVREACKAARGQIIAGRRSISRR